MSDDGGQPDPTPTETTFSLGWSGTDDPETIPSNIFLGFGSQQLPATHSIVNRLPPIGDQGSAPTLLIALLLLWPVMIGAALAVKFTSAGPIIFKQKRHGFNNEVIEVYKFRSMYTNMSDPTARAAERWRRHSQTPSVPGGRTATATTARPTGRSCAS